MIFHAASFQAPTFETSLVQASFMSTLSFSLSINFSPRLSSMTKQNLCREVGTYGFGQNDSALTLNCNILPFTLLFPLLQITFKW